MKMLNKKLVEEASENHIKSNYSKTEPDLFGMISEDFKAGVEWAESQMEELTIEFAEWIKSEIYLEEFPETQWKESSNTGSYLTSKELLKQFLKERDENKE
jgi:hypothetical protein